MNCLNFIFRLYSASVQKYSFLCVDLIFCNSFISFKCVCIVCIFFKISHMSSVNIVLLLPFWSICLLFLFLAYLLWLEPPQVLKRSSECKHPCLVPDFKGKVSVSHH